MLKFNNDNIFTGYLKQLLATFNLPKFRVYTKEQQEFAKNASKRLEANKKNIDDAYESVKKELDTQFSNNLITKQEYNELLKAIKQNWRDCILDAEQQSKQELNLIVSTKIHNKVPSIEESWELNKYPQVLNYTPYIKDNAIQYYLDGAWYDSHIGLSNNLTHFENVHKKDKTSMYRTPYVYNKKYANWTKNLVIKNNIYDSYTHEYLGDYLRFQRDYNNLNLMPLYNCFSNRICSTLNTKIQFNGYTAEFNTLDGRYKIYMVPVKFFQNYTIALSSEYAIEMFCGSFDHYLNDGKQEDLEEELLERLIKSTYHCFNSIQFSRPELYTKLNDFIKDLTEDEVARLSLFEDTLKLFIKVPIKNTSTITILEGDYTNYSNSFLSTSFNSRSNTEIRNNILNKEIVYKNICTCGNTNCTCQKQNIRKTNHTVINLDGDIEKISKKLITPLQLLRVNTGISYPFADRLIEYLIGNNITHIDDIADNTLRANVACRMASLAITDVPADSFWNPTAQVLFYNFINKKHNNVLINHDVLGYVDKDVENLFTFKIDNKNMTLAQTDIYDEPSLVKVVETYE